MRVQADRYIFSRLLQLSGWHSRRMQCARIFCRRHHAPGALVVLGQPWLGMLTSHKPHRSLWTDFHHGAVPGAG